MDIEDTRKCNLMNLNALAKYFSVPEDHLLNYYFELIDDVSFLDKVNAKILNVKKEWGFAKGIFAKDKITSIDWFAFERILIYVLIRYWKPKKILETGVYYGGNTAFALLALDKNKEGALTSIDYPDFDIRKSGDTDFRHSLVGDTELYNPLLKPGFMIPQYLKDTWKLIEGDSLKIIPSIIDEFDFYIHDSDHSMKFLTKELTLAREKLSCDAIMLVDDIDWSNAFYGFCIRHRLYPLMLTDNGKDNLRVRTGLVKLNHPKNENEQFT